ncbi:MAG: NUDIX hydrolase [Deltaproteobacteria bacterium]|nr:NUDIX hydrolase [Deltaproteobacteria bacterium]
MPAMSSAAPAIARPAATVVLLRDGQRGCEVLLVRRNVELAFHGGAWVFPGGRIDAQDYPPGSDDVLAAARNAAVREAREEAAVVIDGQSLVLVSRWITPDILPKRFDTWFFAAPAAHDTVQVDGNEIHAHRWLRADEALAAQRTGEIDLPPPTFVTLLGLSAHRTASAALAAVARGPVQTFFPRPHPIPGGACTLYDGDAGYESGDPAAPGPRHRLLMIAGGWQYERSS